MKKSSMWRISCLALLAGLAMPQAASAKCLNSGAGAIPPLERAKSALLDEDWAGYWETLDPFGGISEQDRRGHTESFRDATGRERPLDCILVQRLDFSEDFAAEAFMVDYPSAFLWIVLYAYRSGGEWRISYYKMNTDFSEIQPHLK